MPEIHSVLTTVAYTGWHLEALKEMFAPASVLVLDPEDEAGIAAALPVVDVAVLRADLDARFASTANIKWIHCDHSGLNRSAIPEVFARRDLAVTGSAGRAAPALAQHAMFLALGTVYDVQGLERDRRAHAWRGSVNYDDRRGFWGKTIGIVGLGHTGRELVGLAGAFGMRVLAYGRGEAQRIDGIDEYFDAADGAGIDRLLAESDLVVLAIRLTDETHHMIGARELRLMKPSGILVNIARGPVVDEEALVVALRDGVIAGAGLDVFEQEPLPADASIWDAPNTVLTHHQTAEMPDLVARSLDIIRENVRRYRADEPLLNALRPTDVYSH